MMVNCTRSESLEHYVWEKMKKEILSPAICGARGHARLDIFSPIRHDWLIKDDDYLRG